MKPISLTVVDSSSQNSKDKILFLLRDDGSVFYSSVHSDADNLILGNSETYRWLPYISSMPTYKIEIIYNKGTFIKEISSTSISKIMHINAESNNGRYYWSYQYSDNYSRMHALDSNDIQCEYDGDTSRYNEKYLFKVKKLKKDSVTLCGHKYENNKLFYYYVNYTLPDKPTNKMLETFYYKAIYDWYIDSAENFTDVNIENYNPKFKIGESVYHKDSREHCTITEVNIENEKVIYTCCIESDEPGIDDEYFVAEEDELK